MTESRPYPFARKARSDFPCPCGRLILTGERVFRWPGGTRWLCATCAHRRARYEAARDRERAAWQAEAEGRL